MDLLNNWLVQAIIGNFACFILSKIAKWFIANRKSNKNNNTKVLSKYSKKILRKEFYISLIIAITSTPIFFFTSDNSLKLISFIGIFFGIFFVYCAFECALECFEDTPSNRCK